MELTRTACGLVAAVALVAQAVASLVSAPGSEYTGTTADVVADSLFTVALVALAVHLLTRPGEGVPGWAVRSSALGCGLLACSTAATVVAGREAWDAAFVLGFVLAALGWLVAAVAGRSVVHACFLPGLVLTLALFASAGALALAGATLLSLRGLPDRDAVPAS